MIPVILCEEVGGTFSRIAPDQLSQVGIQAFYAMSSYEVDSIVSILTDQHTWHILKFVLVYKGPESPIIPLVNIVWYKCFTVMSDRKELVSYLSALL